MVGHFPSWVGAERCSDGPQDGVEAFAAAVLDMGRYDGIYNLGIFNCRTVRGGSTTSLHGEGRAWDAGHEVGAVVGRRLLRDALRRPGRLGIQCIIHERRIYSALSPEGREYTGAVPHLDHLHIEFTWKAAQNLTVATVREVLAPAQRRPGQRNLRVGCRGADVRWVQRRLNIEVDGIYGPKTARRVARFERHRPRYIKHADGVITRRTWQTLGVKPTY